MMVYITLLLTSRLSIIEKSALFKKDKSQKTAKDSLIGHAGSESLEKINTYGSLKIYIRKFH